MLHGKLLFRFSDGLTWHCMVYLAHRFEGIPRETEEAVPLWFPVETLPYDEMWDDDRHWLPMLIAGRFFTGTVEVNGEEVTRHTFQIS